MKVLDLQCPHGHRFEGWFASADEFEAQLSRKLVECPVCGTTEVNRLPSAPRLNLSGATQAQPVDSRALQAQVMRALREVLEKPRMWVSASPRKRGASITTRRRHAAFGASRRPKTRNPWPKKAST